MLYENSFCEVCKKAKQIIMRHLILFIIAITSGINGYSQFGYTAYQKVDGLNVSTKWGKARDVDGIRKPALLLAFENTNNYPVSYSFDILLYYEGVLRENGRIEDVCLDGLKSSIGKLNGIYFIPQKFTEEQLKNSDFKFVIEDLLVQPIAQCVEPEEMPVEE